MCPYVCCTEYVSLVMIRQPKIERNRQMEALSRNILLRFPWLNNKRVNLSVDDVQ